MKTKNNNIDNMFLEGLGDMRVEPSEELKRRVDKSLFFVNLFHYNKIKFFAGIFFTVGIIAGAAILLNSVLSSETSNIKKIAERPLLITKNIYIKNANEKSSSNNKLASNEKVKEGIFSSIQIKSKTSEITINSVARTQSSRNINKTNSDKISKKVNKFEKNSTVNKNNYYYATLPVNKEKSEVLALTKNSVPDKNLVLSESTIEIAEADNTMFSDELIRIKAKTKNEENEIKQKEGSEKSTLSNLKTTKNVYENKNTANAESLLKTGNREELVITESKKEIDNNVKSNQQPTVGSFIMNDTVASLPPDTVINYQGKKMVVNPLTWSIGAYWDVHHNLSNLGANATEKEPFTSLRNNALKNGTDFSSFGMNVNLQYQGLLFQTGLAYTSFSETYNYKDILKNPKENILFNRNNNTFNYQNGSSYFMIDTTGTYNHYTYALDSIIHIIDSVRVFITDTSRVSLYDSTKTIVFDTLKSKRYRNNYSYFEIPLLAGYQFTYGAFDFALKGGLIAGYLMRADGEIISLNDKYEVVKIKDELPFRKIMFSGVGAITATYNINRRFGIWLEPYYRQNLTSLFTKNSAIAQQMRSYGLKVGLKIKF